jgi:hypothetical protein
MDCLLMDGEMDEQMKGDESMQCGNAVLDGGCCGEERGSRRGRRDNKMQRKAGIVGKRQLRDGCQATTRARTWQESAAMARKDQMHIAGCSLWRLVSMVMRPVAICCRRQLKS